jgi:ADP-ribose pyrophosphatase YjhB (NUDIX family)
MYSGKSDNPFYESFGAVLTNDSGKICAHHFTNDTNFSDPLPVDELYILMRETVEVGESLTTALKRGLSEEFGATGKVNTYLGSIKSHFDNQDGVSVEKTTCYFHVRCTHFDPQSRDEDDPESISEIVWLDPKQLIKKMESQSADTDRTDLNDTKIVKRYLQHEKT